MSFATNTAGWMQTDGCGQAHPCLSLRVATRDAIVAPVPTSRGTRVPAFRRAKGGKRSVALVAPQVEETAQKITLEVGWLLEYQYTRNAHTRGLHRTSEVCDSGQNERNGSTNEKAKQRKRSSK